MEQIQKIHDKLVCGLEYSFNNTTTKCYHKCMPGSQTNHCGVHGDCYVDSEGKPNVCKLSLFLLVSQGIQR